MTTVHHVVWLYQSYLANLVGPAARRLRADYGLATTLVCYNRSSLPVPGRHDFDPADFEEIVELDPYLVPDPQADHASLGRLAARAKRIERHYGISLMEAIRSDRLAGIGFVMGVWFPRSKYGRELDYPKTLAVAVTVAEAVEALLERLDPVVVVGASSAMGPSILWRMAAAKGIPTRNLVIARSGAGLFWCDDDFMRPIGLEKIVADNMQRLAREADGGAVPETGWMPAPYRAQVAMKAIARRSGLVSLVRQLGNATRNSVVRQIRGRGRVYGTYLLPDQLRLIFNRWRWRRRIAREPAAFAALPPDAPFVFFPLQVEPEATLMFESPMCDNALTAIDWLAKTVPGGWLLVVKEHPGATAPRPKGFWEQIRRYPNVVVAGTLEDSEAIVRRARVVAILNSSLGLQAAGIGKPVITFHPGFIGSMLGHVQVVDSYEGTKTALRRVRDDDLPPMPQRMLEVTALRQALDQCQFPASDPQILSGVAQEKPVERSDLQAIVDGLLDSLPGPSRQAANA